MKKKGLIICTLAFVTTVFVLTGCSKEDVTTDFRNVESNIQDTAEEMLNCIIYVFENKDSTREIVKAAYDLVCEEYDWNVIIRNFVKIINSDLL